MESFLRPVDLKLARAVQQTNEIVASVTAWTAANPPIIRSELVENRMRFRIVFDGFATEPPLEAWGLAIGECMHNLRSALDNLAYALSRLQRDPPPKPRDVSFPIYLEEEKFAGRGKESIRQMPSEAQQVIEALQPFQRKEERANGQPTFDGLHLLQKLNNEDKHRIPSLVFITPREIKFEHSLEFRNDDEATANTPTAQNIVISASPLARGAVFLEQTSKHPIVQVHGNVAVTAVVAFDSLPGESLFHILGGLTEYTHIVVAQFRRFF